MATEDPKLQKRIDRRKEKVERLIAQYQSRLESIDQAVYLRPENHQRDVSAAMSKLQQLQQELAGLESGRRPRL
ncbi:MAG: hypothetical protein WD535_03295 [Thermaerobacterales bacterium]